MWNEGKIKSGKNTYEYWVKTCEEPSATFGLNGSRIIKMMLKRDGKVMMSYERGWDIEPKDYDTQKVFSKLCAIYD